MFGAEVTSAIVVPFVAIGAVLAIPVRTDLFYPVSADSGRQVIIGNFYPGAVMVAGTMPAVAVVEIKEIRHENNVIGSIRADIKAKPGWSHKKGRHLEID
jgi:hypothetical protein